MITRSLKEKIIKNIFFIFALVSIFVLGLIIIFLFIEGLPIFNVVSIGDFIFGLEWYPTYDPPSFGILSLIVGSFIVTFFATIIAVPLGVLSAVYIAEIAPSFIKEIFNARKALEVYLIISADSTSVMIMGALSGA